jgi:hypothetical protein
MMSRNSAISTFKLHRHCQHSAKLGNPQTYFVFGRKGFWTNIRLRIENTHSSAVILALACRKRPRRLFAGFWRLSSALSSEALEQSFLTTGRLSRSVRLDDGGVRRKLARGVLKSITRFPTIVVERGFEPATTSHSEMISEGKCSQKCATGKQSSSYKYKQTSSRGFRPVKDRRKQSCGSCGLFLKKLSNELVRHESSPDAAMDAQALSLPLQVYQLPQRTHYDAQKPRSLFGCFDQWSKF